MTSADFPRETIRVSGLKDDVEIVIDRWGVPHIYAADAADAYLAQGFAVARDRLWQIDLWRKRGLGRLSEDFGAAYVEADRAARLLLYRGDMDAEWASYGAEARQAAEAFTRGINAFIAFLDLRPEKMPLEFIRTGTRPARWQAEDCVRIRSHGPLFNFDRELARADVVSRFGLEGEAARRRPEPDWTINLPRGVAAEPVPPEVKRTFVLGTNQPAFPASGDGPAPVDGGSNNWAVAGSRTGTGRPILASDPHRLLFLPSLRYVSHLNAPGLDVIGAGEPAVPGIAVGHNPTSAFCFTIHPADQSDLYVYELDPDDPRRYRHGTGWERMQSIRETVQVRDGAPEEIELLFTRHGPVLHLDPARQRAYALRSIWSEPGSAPYLCSLRYMRVESWAEFVEARSHWKSPTMNHVYADTHGDIGWIMSGHIPVRPNWDGLLPVPGDGSHEWAGFAPSDAQPRSHNPAQGWVATANEMNLPEDFDNAMHKFGFEWCDPSRYRVIAEVLDAQPKHALSDSVALQTSFVSDPARRLVRLLADVVTDDPVAGRAIALLSGWDGDCTADSAPALLFEIWFRKHLIEAVSEALMPGAFAHFDPGSIAHFDTLQIVDLLTAPDTRFGATPVAVRDTLIVRTLVDAWAEAVDRAGDDPARWRWGDLHHARFTHPLSGMLGDATLDTRRVPKGGSGLTPNAADYDPADFRMTVGASFRMVLDVGDWDKALFINAPGQSGDPLSRHYDDHLDAWQNESYFPLLFSRESVEAAASRRLLLVPA
ncbi:penicillin acylase family protein [Frigidibacter sp. ROC022]|uniref:penicillin acylase family protein n=1 Tax=Frigidibacter sp. ROC022 TaxID=2971796 RepID=UPI00215AAA04|nr:penicillin acylase family protein [Frigidibacter sp. ROC022]MCR8722711.1 penicillin acylase family protein [Frigidibacter sp. ROC022]